MRHSFHFQNFFKFLQSMLCIQYTHTYKRKNNTWRLFAAILLNRQIRVTRAAIDPCFNTRSRVESETHLRRDVIYELRVAFHIGLPPFSRRSCVRMSIGNDLINAYTRQHNAPRKSPPRSLPKRLLLLTARRPRYTPN